MSLVKRCHNGAWAYGVVRVVSVSNDVNVLFLPGFVQSLSKGGVRVMLRVHLWGGTRSPVRPRLLS